MKVFAADEVARALPYRDLIEALRVAFAQHYEIPLRGVHSVTPHMTYLLMPAWSHRFTGLKTVTVKTDNAKRGLPTIQGSYLLIDNDTGAPVAIMDGGEITRRRTAAASALAADYLARDDASRLVMVGAGALARHFVRAHAALRPIRRVTVFSRTLAHSEAVAGDLRDEGFDARATADLEPAVRAADIVSCATGASEVIVKGTWLKPGAHLDLAGSYTPTMRECDAEAVGRSRVYVDVRASAREEAGDLIQAEAEGRFAMNRIVGDLFDLCRKHVAGRAAPGEITLFKSSGSAIEDLAAAELVYRQSLPKP
jgi:ornithine cyclodeaminase